MGLSTHVLDTMHGRPAAGMRVRLYATGGPTPTPMGEVQLNEDGRNPNGLLIAHEALRAGTYRLAFEVGDYFRRLGLDLPEPAFLEVVNLDFGVAQPQQHYHVPLLVSPWSYATYRGS